MDKLFEDIPTLEPGDVVFLTSDLKRATPMNVVLDFVANVREEKIYKSADEMMLRSVDDYFTGNILHHRKVMVRWLNSQRKIETLTVAPPELVLKE